MRYWAHAYIARDSSRAIVAAVHLNQVGIGCEEDDSLSVIDGPFDVEVLGVAVLIAARSARRIQRNLRDRKMSDWGALRASGARSGREFEADYIMIDVISANEANLIFELTGYPEPNAVLRVTSHVSTTASKREIGEIVLKTFNACRDRRL